MVAALLALMFWQPAAPLSLFSAVYPPTADTAALCDAGLIPIQSVLVWTRLDGTQTFTVTLGEIDSYGQAVTSGPCYVLRITAPQ